MNIFYICAGTGSYYCGSCLRDVALVRGLKSLGHQVEVISLYLPLFPEDDSEYSQHPIFMGGVNIYLQEKLALFRALPPAMDKLLNSRAFLQRVAEKWTDTEPGELGPLTLSMLQGPKGKQGKEIKRFTRWLRKQPTPDLVCFSNALLLGLAEPVREALGVPVLCTLQGEEPFLDELPQPFREQAWTQLQQVASLADAFIAVSSDYGARMATRMAVPPEKIAVVHNGIHLEGFRPKESNPTTPEESPVIGFLARICPYKGAHRLVDAFIELHAHLQKQGATLRPRLRIAGVVTQADEAFLQKLKASLENAGLAELVDFQTNISREEKQRFLRSLHLFSVPAEATEAFGLYILEALACGVPVVAPAHAAFPEILEKTGGGVLYDPATPSSLCTALEGALADPVALHNLGQRGRKGVYKAFAAEVMAAKVMEVFQAQILPSVIKANSRS